MSVVDIRTHQVIVILILLVDRLSPAFVLADNLEDSLVTGLVVIVDASKVLKAILEGRILVAAAVECVPATCI